MDEKRKKPTIAELEAILDGPAGQIEILPDGSIRANTADGFRQEGRADEKAKALKVMEGLEEVLKGGENELVYEDEKNGRQWYKGCREGINQSIERLQETIKSYRENK